MFLEYLKERCMIKNIHIKEITTKSGQVLTLILDDSTVSAQVSIEIYQPGWGYGSAERLDQSLRVSLTEEETGNLVTWFMDWI